MTKPDAVPQRKISVSVEEGKLTLAGHLQIDTLMQLRGNGAHSIPN